MKIAILGWGSLQWDPRNLKQATEFEPNGPALHVEFSRVSGKEGTPRRLTLVIDEVNGTCCVTSVAESAFNTLSKAKENLREREGMTHVNGVGFIDRQSGEVSSRAKERHPITVQAIRSWLDPTDFEAVIWTALASNFAEQTKEPFSVEAALRFLTQRPADQLGLALEYLRRAPDSVQTPVRAAVAERWPI